MELAELNWPAVHSLPKSMPVVFPIAALEQHGHHLPLVTDSMILGELLRRVAAPLRDKVLFAPLLWLGNSHHHLEFPGTLSAPPRAYLDVIEGLVENVLGHGFRRLVLVNGHGGNIVPAQQAMFEVRQRHRNGSDALLLSATYWELPPASDLAKLDLAQISMGHACEWETSMILAIAPHLVGDISKLPAIAGDAGFAPAHRAWITRERSRPGHIGLPHLATVAKGQALLECFARGLVQFLTKVAAWDGTSW